MDSPKDSSDAFKETYKSISQYFKRTRTMNKNNDNDDDNNNNNNRVPPLVNVIDQGGSKHGRYTFGIFYEDCYAQDIQHFVCRICLL